MLAFSCYKNEESQTEKPCIAQAAQHIKI